MFPAQKPRRTQIPKAPGLKILLAGYEGDEAEGDVEAFEATVAAIERRVFRSELLGGACVALLPKANPWRRHGVEAAFREELERALADGFTQAELASAKAGWLQSRQVSRGSDGALMVDRTLEHDAAHEACVAALSAEDVVEALRRHIDPDALTVVRAGELAGAN